MKKVLILTSGSVNRLDGFKDKGVDLHSFSDIHWNSVEKILKIGDKELNFYDVIYFRFVGKSLEIANLVAGHAKEKGIQIVDKLYTLSHVIPVSQSKVLELKNLSEAGIKIPKTHFGIEEIKKLEFPFVLKSTTGQKAKEVWLVNSKEDFPVFEKGKHYFAQEFIPNATRIRVLVIGKKVVGAIVRQTKWNKDETKETLNPVPENIANLAIESASVNNIDICGVDILVNKVTSEMYVIETNAAPSWKLINKYCNVNVEDEIIKYLQEEV